MPTAPKPASHPCERCGKSLGAVRLPGQKLCKDCKRAIKSAIQAFRPAAAALLSRVGPTGEDWNGLIAQLNAQRVPVKDALAAIEPEAIRFLERFVAFAFADESVTPEELAAFGHFAQQLDVPSSKAEPLRLRLERGMILSQVRAGTLPRTRPQDVYLELDETCHVDIAAQFIRVLAASVVHVPGRILITDRKFRFLGHNAGWEPSWNKIMTVRQTSASTLHLQASQTKGSGQYVVGDPEYIAIVLETVARISRRELLRPNGGLDTRQIPNTSNPQYGSGTAADAASVEQHPIWSSITSFRIARAGRRPSTTFSYFAGLATSRRVPGSDSATTLALDNEHRSRHKNK